ncbi:GNAT family N-acetyltransferase [Streptomyces griseus]|uniref:GNAT family N-acetyltransferase n=1 Tax=Streptomyces griseus TaxID=1911 RepID=UPI0004C9701B|nr:GNAT family N-acetyltransferase [Streptomyces griseus]
MTTELRVLDPSEWDRWFAALELAFGGLAEEPEERALWRDLTECGRSLGVWDGDRAVGTAGAFSFRLTVPGGAAVPAAGVTMVSVAGTHRRRGLLTSMMRRQLDDVRALGEPLAVLTASEPVIYGRFGYGAATWSQRGTIDTTRVRLDVPAGTDEVALRMVPAEESSAVTEAVYARMAPLRPGTTVRAPGWERLPVLDPAGSRNGSSPLLCVVAERAGEVVGYAYYTIRPDWSWAGANGSVVVRELRGPDPAVEAALWRFLCSVDLTTTVRFDSRPVDDAWQHLVSDVRRCEPTVREGLFARLVDVGAALEARTYQAPVDVVFEVADAFCPWNEGRWRLSGDGKGAVCERTSDAADLSLSVRELGAAYLGGTSLAALAGAGRVAELREGALAEASLALGSAVAPWLPHGF